MAKYCANCGTSLPEGAQFCPGCGQGVSQTREETTEQSPTVQRPGGSRLLIGLGVLVAVLAVGLVAVLAYPLLTSGDTAGEAEAERVDFSESIVGNWRGVIGGESISFEFFADGTFSENTGDGTYRFVDDDTITVTFEDSQEVRSEISMLTDDALILIVLADDHPTREAPLVLRKFGESTAPEEQPAKDSIVGDWRIIAVETSSIEFVADGRVGFTGRDGTEVSMYRVVDGDTIALTGGGIPEERVDISMPTEDILILTYLDEDGNPEDALALRRIAGSTEETSGKREVAIEEGTLHNLVEVQIGDFELLFAEDWSAADPGVEDLLAVYQEPGGVQLEHILAITGSNQDADNLRQEIITEEYSGGGVEFVDRPVEASGRQVGTVTVVQIGGESRAVVWNNGNLVAWTTAEEGAAAESFYESVSY